MTSIPITLRMTKEQDGQFKTFTIVTPSDTLQLDIKMLTHLLSLVHSAIGAIVGNRQKILDFNGREVLLNEERFLKIMPSTSDQRTISFGLRTGIGDLLEEPKGGENKL